MDFMNDYYFLEEATRFTKEIKCNKAVRPTRRINFKFTKLRKEALKRNTMLYFLDNALTKRKKNKSFYNSKDQTIHWYVELVFANAGNIKLCKQFSENTKVLEIIKTILDQEASPQLTKQLDFYKSEGIQKLRVFLKAEGLKKSSDRFYEMNLKKSLKANLRGKLIIEYPTLHIVLNHSADSYDLIPSDGKHVHIHLTMFYILFNFILLDESVAIEMKTFSKTLKEEVFSRKIGVNPPLIVKPEEVPIVSEVINDSDKSQCKPETSVKPFNNSHEKPVEDQHIDSDDDIDPKNYFF